MSTNPEPAQNAPRAAYLNQNGHWLALLLGVVLYFVFDGQPDLHSLDGLAVFLLKSCLYGFTMPFVFAAVILVPFWLLYSIFGKDKP